MTFCALPASSAASCDADAKRSRAMFRSRQMSRDVIRIALGSAGRSKNLRRSRTIVSMLGIIPRPHASPFRRLCGRSLCGGRSPVKGGLRPSPPAIAPLTGCAPRRVSHPCKRRTAFRLTQRRNIGVETKACLRAVANLALMYPPMHP